MTVVSTQATGQHARGPLAREAMSEELQSLWREVFERSRVVKAEDGGHPAQGGAQEWRAEQAAEPPTAAQVNAQPGTTEPSALPVVQPSSLPAHSVAQTSMATAPERALPAFAAAPFVAVAFSPVAVSEASGTPPFATPSSHTPTALPTALPTSPALPAGARQATQQEATQCIEQAFPPVESNPVSDEVVQVYHHDGEVAIVIRDLALPADVALRCAFETARRLAGDARALRQVVLNGRSLFNAADEPARARPGPVVSFTC